jgi:hypothetical protein
VARAGLVGSIGADSQLRESVRGPLAHDARAGVVLNELSQVGDGGRVPGLAEQARTGALVARAARPSASVEATDRMCASAVYAVVLVAHFLLAASRSSPGIARSSRCDAAVEAAPRSPVIRRRRTAASSRAESETT